MTATAPLLSVRDMSVRFARHGRKSGPMRAVDGVSFEIERGAVLALVGESGCGKTTLARAILRLIPVHAGGIQFDGRDMLAARGAALRRLRREMQLVFQDPLGSLNPRMTVFDTLAEPLRVHRLARGDALRARVEEVLTAVGLDPTDGAKYPRAFSGGQRQRIGIARALACQPRLLVCDEPVSALDVSVQSQIINLLADLRTRLGLTLLFISHQLAVTKHLANHVAVMYQGKIVEQGPTQAVFETPRHPYTQRLLAAHLEPGGRLLRTAAMR